MCIESITCSLQQGGIEASKTLLHPQALLPANIPTARHFDWPDWTWDPVQGYGIGQSEHPGDGFASMRRQGPT